MSRVRAAPCLVVPLLVLAAPAPAQEGAPPRPTPPLEVPAPKTPPRQLGEHDLGAIDGPTLRANAFDAYQQGALPEAIQLQHWGVGSDGRGQYNLACFYALGGSVDAAFYWLQRAAEEEGVDAEWAAEDPDLEVLRSDPRWGEVVGFLETYSAWWAESGREETLVVVPAGYAVGTPIAAVVGLHGLGSHPRDFAGDSYQELADRLNVAFVGVSGTSPVGPRGYVWSEDPAADAARVGRALEEAADRVTVRPGAVVLIGFSQGAQVALELAVRDPARFAGAVVMSPGVKGGPRLDEVAATEGLVGRGFVIRVGELEHPGNVGLAVEDGRWLRSAGARVDQHAYEGVEEHVFPPDYEEGLAAWIPFVLGDRVE